MAYITYFVTTYLFEESSVYAPCTYTITTTRTIYSTSLKFLFFPSPRVILSHVVKSDPRRRRSVLDNRVYMTLIVNTTTHLSATYMYMYVCIYDIYVCIYKGFRRNMRRNPSGSHWRTNAETWRKSEERALISVVGCTGFGGKFLPYAKYSQTP